MTRKSSQLTNEGDRRTLVFLVTWVFLAFGAGVWLVSGLLESYQNRSLKLRAETTTQEAIFLSRALDQDLSTVRASLSAWAATAAGYSWSGGFQPLVLLESKVQDNKLTGISREAVRPGWNATRPIGSELTFEEFLHRSFLTNVSLSELRSRKFSILRFKLDPSSAREWLIVATLDARGYVLGALLEPEEAFPLFDRWRMSAPKGDARAYVMASDGKVILHSLPSYVGTDLSQSPFFQTVARELFSGGKESGGGSFQGLDQVPVWASYSRISNLPLSLVVERPINRVKLQLGQDIGVDELFALVALAGLCVVGFYLFKGRLIRRELVIQEVPQLIEARASKMAAAEVAAKEESKLLEEGVLSLELDPQEVAHPAFESIDSDLVALSRYEKELASIGNPAKIADRLVAIAVQIMSCPALFFAFHPRHSVAILQASAGFIPGQVPEGMSFPLNSEKLKQFLDSEPESTIASFSDYPSIARMLETRLKAKRFDAWGITSKRTLIGVLVVLRNGDVAPIRDEILTRMVHSTSATYEKTLDL